MKGDFSRRTFDATKHYSAVLVEQGRMLTDADSGEEHEILAYRQEAGLADVIGPSGGPIPGAGFAPTTDGSTLQLGEGVYYVAGSLLENEAGVDITAQPDRFDVPWPPPSGRHAIVLEHWRRLVTALDDPTIREVALGGPTTSARAKAIWQVATVPVADDWVCGDPLPEAEATTGTMAARAEPDAALPSPCLIPPQAGYTGLENQFYRVEVLDSGEAYDLAAAPDTVAVTGVVPGSLNAVVVAAVGTLAVGDAVEVYLTGPGSDPVEATFAHITGIDAGNSVLTLSVALPAFAPTDAPTLRLVGASFVVSRDNGSVVTGIEAIDADEVTVHDLGPDDVLGFSVGQLVELSDDRIELEGLPRQLRQIADIDTIRRVVVLRTPADPLAAGPTGIDPDRHPKLRRWDAAGAIRFLPDGTGWIHLENGNEVRFTTGHYRAGDHWSFPARAATVDAASGTIAWPDDGGAPALLGPFGIERRRAVLGRLDVDDGGAVTNLVDCRRLFPPLTRLRNLLFVGGDGQEADPGDAVGGVVALPGRLAVRVVNGGLPVEGALIRFSVSLGAGRLDGSAAPVEIATNAQGLAAVSWQIDAVTDHQVCTAELLSPAGTPIAHQVVEFNATLDAGDGRRGCCWSIGPGGDYGTIGEALADLPGRGFLEICLCLMPGDHVFEGGGTAAPDDRQPATLSIHGCGRGARLVVDQEWLLERWRSVRLRDFDIRLRPGASISLEAVGDVEVSGCHIRGSMAERALLGVQRFSRLAVTGSLFLARRQETFERLLRLFDGLAPLDLVWTLDDEVDVPVGIEKTALEVAGMTVTARRRLARELATRIQQDPGDILSEGELAAATRLTQVILAEPEVGQVSASLERLALEAAMARGAVAIAVGPAPVGEPDLSAPGVSVLIGDSAVHGTLVLYGHGDPDQQIIPDDTLKLFDAFVTDNLQVRTFAGEVHIRDNRLGRIALSIEMIKLLIDLVGNGAPLLQWAFGSLHLVDNRIDGAVNEVLAGHVVVTGNEFTLAALPPFVFPPNGHVGRVLGDTATYTANHAQRRRRDVTLVILDATRASAEGVNLELQIQ